MPHTSHRVVHCLVVVGVDDVGWYHWVHRAYILFVAVAKNADDKLQLFFMRPSGRVVNCGKTVARLLGTRFASMSVWVVVSVVVVKNWLLSSA